MKLIHIFTVFSTPQNFFDGQFRYLVNEGYDIILVSSKSDLAEAFSKRNGIDYFPVEMPRSMSLGKILSAIRSIINIVRKEKPDAVFGHTPVGALCAMVASYICRVPNRIYYRHGLIYTTMHGYKRAFFKMEEKFVSFLANNIINVSYSLSSLAISDGLNSSDKQYIIGAGTCGGIDAHNLFSPSLIDKGKREQIRVQLRLQNADIVFGFCGRICNDKGIPELLDGFELFSKYHPEIKAKLLLIGRFDSRDGISKTRQDQIINNKDIVISGMIPKIEIPYYYSLLDVFVFPSHREGFGMCVLEASAMEKPILDSRSHGCIDAIVEHETGEYIELSAEGVYVGMEKMLDEKLRQSLGIRGREYVLNNYDYSVMWPKIKDLYVEMLS